MSTIPEESLPNFWRQAGKEAVCARALGGGGQGTGPSAAGGDIVPHNLKGALVGLGDALQVTSTLLLQV